MNRFGCGGTHFADVGLPVASFFNEAKAPPMRTFIDIDYVHSRAIVRSIGERSRAELKPEPELPGRHKVPIDRLRELEEKSPSVVRDAERCGNTRH